MGTEIITSDDILGKEAVDPDGSIIGVVTKVHIDNGDKKVVGITIDLGFTKPDLYMGIDQVRTFGKNAILLKTVPTAKFKGRTVLTSEGKRIGKVIDVVMNNSKIGEFKVSTSWFFGKKFRIKYSDVKEVGENIILKPSYAPEEKD